MLCVNIGVFFQAFAIFCGMGINNTQMYESSVRTTAKHRVALDVLSYHVTAPPEDTQKLKVTILMICHKVKSARKKCNKKFCTGLNIYLNIIKYY